MTQQLREKKRVEIKSKTITDTRRTRKKIKLEGKTVKKKLRLDGCCRCRSQDQHREQEAGEQSVINTEHKLCLMYRLPLSGN